MERPCEGLILSSTSYNDEVEGWIELIGVIVKEDIDRLRRRDLILALLDELEVSNNDEGEIAGGRRYIAHTPPICLYFVAAFSQNASAVWLVPSIESTETNSHALPSA